MANVFHVIKDPVHGSIQFNECENLWIKSFIDSPYMQRLRHIKQLGVGDFIFPGAVHNRFSHSLGCSYIANQMGYKLGLMEEERQLVIIASLLHDIGHGPFSHAFEGVFWNKCIRHEDWTAKFLNAYIESPLFLANYNAVNSCYQINREKFQLIADLIAHHPVKNRVLNDIVSSQLDADRLDYLLRDSHFCGVRYGEFDLQWLLHCLIIVDDQGRSRLGITHKGIGAVEHYVMARRLMTRNIYHSHKNLAFEALLIQFFHYLAANLGSKKYANLRENRLSKFLIAADSFNMQAQSLENNPAQLTLLREEFVEHNFDTYKTLCDYDVFSIIRTLAESSSHQEEAELARRIHTRIMPKIIALDDNELTTVNHKIAELHDQYKNQIQRWQLQLITIPHQAYCDNLDPILVLNAKGKVQPLSYYSQLIQALSNKFENVAFLAIDPLILDHSGISKFIQHYIEA